MDEIFELAKTDEDKDTKMELVALEYPARLLLERWGLTPKRLDPMPSMFRSRRLARVAFLGVLLAASGKQAWDRVTETPTERGVPTKTGKSRRWTHQAVARILGRSG